MPRAELHFLNGERVGEVYRLEQGRTVIGRQVGDLILGDKEVSSIHAIISYERGGWYVMDLGSTNGVFVDDQVKLEARLRKGNELRLGQTRFTFNPLVDENLDDETAVEDFEALAPNAAQTAANVQTIPSPGAAGGQTLVAGQAPAVIDGGALLELASAPPVSVEEPQPTFDPEESGEAPVPGPPMTGGIDQANIEVVIEIVEGADLGMQRVYRQETIIIGRLNTDMVVRDSDVSRRHAIIEVFDPEQIYLRDLNSTNGSHVNGRRVSSVRLRNGDEIRLGRCVLRFSSRVGAD